MTSARPLRFLALALGLWVAARAALLAPGWWQVREEIASALPAAAARTVGSGGVGAAPYGSSAVRLPPRERISRRVRSGAVPPSPGGLATQSVAPPPGPPAPAGTAAGAPAPPASGTLSPPAFAATSSRRAASAWLLVRGDGGAAALAPGGTLGGSQAGARLLYRLGGGLALSGRLYLPLRRTQGAEAAAGLDWQVSRRLPFHLLAERRQRLGDEGRSAFALTLYGGLSRDLPRGFRVDAYGQAGLVGLRARDPFADGSVRVSAPLGPVEVGAGAWAAAQPGAERVDAGPSVSWRLPVRGAAIRLQADWRFRLAGDATPGSGPALTLAADF